MKPGTLPFLKRMLVDGEIFPATERFLGFVRKEKERLGVAPDATEPDPIETEGQDTTIAPGGPCARQRVPR